jgi:hypothetical protein
MTHPYRTAIPSQRRADAGACEPLERARVIARVFLLGWALLRVGVCSVRGLDFEGFIALVMVADSIAALVERRGEIRAAQGAPAPRERGEERCEAGKPSPSRASRSHHVATAGVDPRWSSLGARSWLTRRSWATRCALGLRRRGGFANVAFKRIARIPAGHFHDTAAVSPLEVVAVADAAVTVHVLAVLPSLALGGWPEVSEGGCSRERAAGNERRQRQESHSEEATMADGSGADPVPPELVVSGLERERYGQLDGLVTPDPFGRAGDRPSG